jgi:hypothetical protein
MNPFQTGIARLTGIEEVIQSKEIELQQVQSGFEEKEQDWTNQFAEITEALEHIDAQNALLQRQIEDIDYLNLFDIGAVQDIIPIGDRKKTINKLRRLRQENPLAKQAIRLIVRFTLGKGIEIVVGPDPETKVPLQPLVNDGGAPLDSKNGKGNQGKTPFPATATKTGSYEAISNLPPEPDHSPGSVASLANDELKQQVQAFWKDPDNKRMLTSRPAMQEWVDSVATDGEKFFIGFEGDAEPYVKLTEVPIEQIDNIIYDPNNWQKPVYYVRCWMPQVYDGDARRYIPKANTQPIYRYYLDYRILLEEIPDLKKRIKIKASELADEKERILHTLINPLWTKKGKRGISELYASREWFRVYKEFMEDRAAINAAATAIAYKRKIKGGPTEVARFANRLGPLNVGYESEQNVSEISKLTRPAGAGIYDSNPAVDLDWMKADTGAVNAKEDGRSILGAAGAGIGMFVHYFGDGGDANLATAQAMELPMVKTFEDWQQWVEDALREFCFWVIRVATDQENAAKQIDRIAGSFPPIISQDVVKYMTAWGQLVSNVAAGNRVVKREAIKGAMEVMNVPNIDSLMNEIDSEEQQLELQRQAQHQAMVEALSNGFDPNAPPGANGNGRKKAPRTGDSNALDPNLKTIAKGKPPIARAGPKPPK